MNIFCFLRIYICSDETHTLWDSSVPQTKDGRDHINKNTELY